ncbi:MAG: hypothetical protein O2V44_02555 [Candidatus Bathyarchaeota archaeon]|nr:hypothetical protein [Candidatus Bathyarchaeota archaeon]
MGNVHTTEQNLHKFTLRFFGGNSDRVFFFEGLNDLEGSKSLVWPTPNLTDDQQPQLAFSGFDLVAESMVMIIATAGSIATIANFIYTFLKDRAEKEKVETTQGKVLIHSNSRRIEITGKYSRADIIKILKATEMVDSRKAYDWLQRKSDRLAKSEFENELKSLEDAYPKYQKLLELYEEDKNLKPWQKRDYRKFKARTKSLASEIKKLKRKIRQLEKRTLS